MELNPSVFDTFPVLQTRRLTLRDIREEDAPQIFGMRSNPNVNRFIARPSMEKAEDAGSLVERTRKAWEQKQAIGWAGLLRDSSHIVGTCGFNSIDHPNLRAEIGGELSVDKWGKNIALEAVSAIVHFGLKSMNLHSIEAKVSPQNRGAVFLLEHLGFEKEAHYKDRIRFNGTFLDMAVYSLIRGNEKNL